MKNFFSSVKNYLSGSVTAITNDPAAAHTSGEFWVYLAGNVVLTLFFMNIFFWLLWTMIVYKGGIFIKVQPLLAVVFTSKTLADYGYEGWPYEPGIFDGFLENFVALILFGGFVILCWLTYDRIYKRAMNVSPSDNN